ncbi:hypothetical protein GE061_013065 [Apolygus lucorum]|uniref:Retrotransposon gag domain-containing protein n=1 Tax=Apolygus lucorum TaxID=248454 RepID=A0A8S9XU32_APOLU|nr:hypothetical protein GE061_013065 [Apolygus lucorum]
MDSHQSVADRVRQRRREHSAQDEEESIHNEDVAFADAGDQQPEQPQLPFLVNDLLRQFAEMTREFQSMRERELQRPGPATREKIDIIHPPTYDGSTPWDEYWAQFRAIKTANDWGPTTAAVRLMAALRGSALAAVCNVPEDQRYLSTMEDALSRRFGAQGQARLFLARLRQRIQGASEDVASFAADVESLARRAMPSEEAREAVAVEQFLNGLRNQRVRELVISGDPTTLRDAMTRAAMLEAGLCSNRLQQVRSVTWDDDTSLVTDRTCCRRLEHSPASNIAARVMASLNVVADVESLARRAMPSEEAREAVAVEQFLNGLRNQRATGNWYWINCLDVTHFWVYYGDCGPSIHNHLDLMKIRYECKAWKLRFKQEDKVWLHNPKRLKRGSPQQQCPWEGPYTVVERINDILYRLRSTNGSLKIVRVDRLISYCGTKETKRKDGRSVVR